jgi:hypothetical protein
MQISKLQQARALLFEGTATATTAVKRAGRGRPKGSKNSAKKSAVVAAKTVAKTVAKTAAKPKRNLSPEGRKRIAEAMKKRWAERRKVAVK